jgi:hypothetical protein
MLAYIFHSKELVASIIFEWASISQKPLKRSKLWRIGIFLRRGMSISGCGIGLHEEEVNQQSSSKKTQP